MNNAVEAVGLTKEYPRRRPLFSFARGPKEEPQLAVDSVDLQIAAGELFGLLGANGAGKTTLVKMFSTLLIPTTGHARINGLDVIRESTAVKKMVGLVDCQDRSFFWRLTGRQNLAFFASIYGLQGAEATRRIDDLLSLTGLAAHERLRFSDYSSGMKQMLAVARGLLTMPSVLFMDEPTRSLDPVSASKLRTFIQDVLIDHLRCTVVLVTHRLDEAEELCDRVGIMNGGKLVACGPTADIKKSLNYTPQYELEVRKLASPNNLRLQSVPGVTNALWTATASGLLQLTVRMDKPADTLPQLFSIIMQHGGEIHQCKLCEPSLEDAFVSIIGAPVSATSNSSMLQEAAAHLPVPQLVPTNSVGGS